MSEYCTRLRSMEAIGRSSIHQSLATPSSHLAMARSRSSTLNDPKRALDLIRSLIQSEINSKIHQLMQDYVSRFFEPAFKNMQRNLGAENVSTRLLEEVCVNALEHSKKIFCFPKTEIESDDDKFIMTSKHSLKRKSKSGFDERPRKRSFPGPDKESPATDLILISKQGQPVRREGEKWDPKRLMTDTLFVLGSKASRALRLSHGRSRLCIKHPNLFRYCCDHSDKEWLYKNRLISNVDGKAYLMVLQDIFELNESSKYDKGDDDDGAKMCRNEETKFDLRGFKCPSFMIKKMCSFVKAVKTDPGVPDEELLQQAHLQIAKWNSEAPRLMADLGPASAVFDNVEMSREDLESQEDVEDDSSSLLDELADEDEEDDEEDGFLQGVNLTSLVREFEMEASNSGSQNLGILSLADDNAFSQLHDEDPGVIHNSEDDLNDIDFN